MEELKLFIQQLLQQMQQKRIEFQEQTKANLEKQWINNASISFSPESVANSINEFLYVHEDITFLTDFTEYESIFRDECQRLSDENILRLQLQQLCPAEDKKIYISVFNYFKYFRIVSVNKTVSISKTLREKKSLFYTFWRIKLTND